MLKTNHVGDKIRLDWENSITLALIAVIFLCPTSFENLFEATAPSTHVSVTTLFSTSF